MSRGRPHLRRAGAFALLALAAGAACGDEPELTLQIRLPPDDQGQFTAVTQLNLTASRDDVVLAQRSFSANTSSVSLVGVPHGPRTIIALEGVDRSNQVIAFGQTCPLDFKGPNTREPLYFAPTSFFAPTADTPAARYRPVGAALSDGTVLLVGGSDFAGAALPTVELFVPGAATFSAVEDHAVARKSAQSAVLPGVGLLIVGGIGADDKPVADAEVFLDVQRRFVTITDPRLARIDHQVATLPDGRALVIGGMALEAPPAGDTTPASWTTLASTLYVAVMDDGTYKVSPAPTLAEARREHTATVAIGTPIVFGGYDVNGLPLSSIEAINIGYGSSEVIAHLKTPRAEATASVLPDGSILLIGGTGPNGMPLADAELFNPITRTTQAIELVSPRHGHSATVLPDGRVLVAGGFINGEPITDVELFRPDFGLFVNEHDLGTARARHLALHLCDGTVLLMGGGTGAELYTGTPQ
jgi:hypothetical protein